LPIGTVCAAQQAIESKMGEEYYRRRPAQAGGTAARGR
jgi:hypothetical protein